MLEASQGSRGSLSQLVLDPEQALSAIRGEFGSFVGFTGFVITRCMG